ncbi:30S ribosomal protein S4 [Kiritimatiella glycovorans]|uniref:Small ribosomal subunit protein uS4 n=1 Tax=Kiritimatiella glycovorans TaxID=1307763 RepID=A0A0G3EF70_9BACT|nr:30S ribosomal protein S4 [Kiritimatiella glycovorans]AKJ64983.1 30S ribosomal protein S4 [Kiritimatiella glycovorans]
MNKPKIKVSRRLGVALTPKAHKYMERRPHPPGMHGTARRRPKLSDYGRQLLEKQRLRHQYNLREQQLANYFEKAVRRPGNSGEILMQLLESRLDAAVVRGGFARTIFQARQLVNHGHFRVNDRKVDIPSYHLREGDVVTPREKSREVDAIRGALDSTQSPEYLRVDPKNMSITFERVPTREEIPVICEVPLVIEFYSR